MSIREYTKQLFADALLEMIAVTPLQKVRVKNLCERCGAERPTFYYHFRDKYDLVAWIYMRDYEAALKECGGSYREEHIASTLRRLWEKREFYRKAFADRSQNAISEYLLGYFINLGEDTVKQRFSLEELTPEMRYAVKSHAFASIGHTVEWLNGTSQYTPEEFARLQYLFMPEFLKQAYGVSENSAGRETGKTG